MRWQTSTRDPTLPGTGRLIVHFTACQQPWAVVQPFQATSAQWKALGTVCHNCHASYIILYDVALLARYNFPGRPFVVHSFDIVPRTKADISDLFLDVSLWMMLPDAFIFWRFQSWHAAEMSWLKHLETWRFSLNLALTKHPHSSDWPKPLLCNQLHSALAPKPFCISILICSSNIFCLVQHCRLAGMAQLSRLQPESHRPDTCVISDPILYKCNIYIYIYNINTNYYTVSF